MLRDLRELLAPVPALWERSKKLAGGPVPGSTAARDCLTPMGQQAWILGFTAVNVGIDHLEVWRRLAEARIQPTFAHLTLIRGALEGAALARYLADPKIDGHERLRRGVGAYDADLEERAKYEPRRPDLISPTGKTARERRKDLAEDCEVLRIKPRQLLGPTELCARYIDTVIKQRDGEYVYRLLSAFAHGKQWPILPGSEAENYGPAPGLTGAFMTRITANPRLAAELSVVAVDTVTAAVTDLERYAGLEGKE